MKYKTATLMILMLVIFSISACSFKIGNTSAQTDSQKATAEKSDNQTPESDALGKKKNNSSDTKTGTYKYKGGGARNEINVQELEGNKLRVALYASYEYKSAAGLWNANVGEATGIVSLNGDTAILVSENAEDCKISLKFAGNKIIVDVKNELQLCGFGLNVSAKGTYVKTGNKPDFGDTNEDSASEQSSKPERINFAKGKSSAVVSGRIINKQNVTYLLRARKGQTLEVKITEGGANNDVVFYTVAPDGSFPMGEDDEGFGTVWKEKLAQSGDYKIVLGTIEAENAGYKMLVSIR